MHDRKEYKKSNRVYDSLRSFIVRNNETSLISHSHFWGHGM